MFKHFNCLFLLRDAYARSSASVYYGCSRTVGSWHNDYTACLSTYINNKNETKLSLILVGESSHLHTSPFRKCVYTPNGLMPEWRRPEIKLTSSWIRQLERAREFIYFLFFFNLHIHKTLSLKSPRKCIK